MVGVNGMVCKECGSEVELMHINENYVAHGTCRKCQGASHQKLKINLIFNNLRVSCTDKHFRLLPRKGVYPYKYMDIWGKFEENHLPPTEAFTANSTCQELVSVTMTMLREFGESLG